MGKGFDLQESFFCFPCRADWRFTLNSLDIPPPLNQNFQERHRDTIQPFSPGSGIAERRQPWPSIPVTQSMYQGPTLRSGRTPENRQKALSRFVRGSWLYAPCVPCLLLLDERRNKMEEGWRARQETLCDLHQLAAFVTHDPDVVASPWGAACANLITWPLKYLFEGKPRPCLDAGIPPPGSSSKQMNSL